MQSIKRALWRLGGWIKDRLLDGYEALCQYRWARVILGFFAFLIRGVVRVAEGIQNAITRLVESDVDSAVDSRLDAMTEKGAARARHTGQSIYSIYDRLYRTHRMAIKMGLTTFLLVVALVLLMTRPNRYTALAAAAMGLSWVSDALLMQYPPLRRGVRQFFLWGMVASCMAMCIYTNIFMQLFSKSTNEQGQFVLICICAVFMLAAVLLWLFAIAFNARQMRVLRGATLVYLLLTALMAGCASAVALASGGRVWWLFIGAVGYFVANVFVALFNFGSLRKRHPDGWVWAFYAPAQALLLTGIAAAGAIL